MAKDQAPQQPQKQPDPLLVFQLPLTAYNTVLEALGELPAKRSHMILQSMQFQALQQLNAAKQEAAKAAEKTEADKEALRQADEKRARKGLKLVAHKGNGAKPPAA